MNVVVEGLLCGLLLSFLLGPVFIGLVKTSLLKGFKEGVFFAMGVALSDIFYISIAYWGIVSLINDPFIENIFYLVGGMLLFGFGVFYLFQKGKNIVKEELEEEEIIAKVSKKSNTVLKGFLMNAINPSVLFFWIGVVGVADASAEGNPYNVFVFFACAIGVVFGCDVLKAFLAHRISSFVKDSWILYLNRGLGLILCVLGFMFVWDTLKMLLIF